MRDEIILRRKFSEIPLEDSFFDSLRETYREFDRWFRRKSGETAYVVFTKNRVSAFLYVKLENGPIDDIVPPLETDRCLKVGTFKIDAHGTRLGERFVKKIFDHALAEHVDHVYVTVFEKHEGLISILKRYGFTESGTKTTTNGTEKVFVKTFGMIQGDIKLDYPAIRTSNVRKWLLAIYPEYHTRLFPDSILKTERSDIITDISHTNSIHKVYIGRGHRLNRFSPGDVIVAYRTCEEGKTAEYSSVATSLCVTQEVMKRSMFDSENDFIKYCTPYSVFSTKELRSFYNTQTHPLYTIKMTYNLALPKRPIRKKLIEEVGLPRQGAHWALILLSDEQFSHILELGQIHAGIIVN